MRQFIKKYKIWRIKKFRVDFAFFALFLITKKCVISRKKIAKCEQKFARNVSFAANPCSKLFTFIYKNFKLKDKIKKIEIRKLMQFF